MHSLIISEYIAKKVKVRVVTDVDDFDKTLFSILGIIKNTDELGVLLIDKNDKEHFIPYTHCWNSEPRNRGLVRVRRTRYFWDFESTMVIELTENKYQKLYNKIIKNTFKEGYDVKKITEIGFKFERPKLINETSIRYIVSIVIIILYIFALKRVIYL